MEGGRGHPHLYKLSVRAELHVHGSVCPSQGPGTWRGAEVHVTCEHPERGSQEGISQAQNVFFSPWTLLSSFSLPLLLFNFVARLFEEWWEVPC